MLGNTDEEEGIPMAGWSLYKLLLSEHSTQGQILQRENGLSFHPRSHSLSSVLLKLPVLLPGGLLRNQGEERSH